MKRLFPVLLLALLLFGSLQNRARAASTPPEKTASGSPGENPNKHATFNPVLTIQLQRDAAMWGEGTVLDVDVGPNLYAYVRQNPWSSFDPLGLSPWLTIDPNGNVVRNPNNHPCRVCHGFGPTGYKGPPTEFRGLPGGPRAREGYSILGGIGKDVGFTAPLMGAGIISNLARIGAKQAITRGIADEVASRTIPGYDLFSLGRSLRSGSAPLDYFERQHKGWGMPKYSGKWLPNLKAGEDSAKGIKKFTQEELAKHEISIVNGKAVNKMTGKPVNTGSSGGIYVMDQNGKFYVHHGPRGNMQPGDVHHSSMDPSQINGAGVVGAGEIRINNGKIEHVNRKSGHYKPKAETLDTVKSELRDQGADLRGTRFPKQER